MFLPFHMFLFSSLLLCFLYQFFFFFPLFQYLLLIIDPSIIFSIFISPLPSFSPLSPLRFIISSHSLSFCLHHFLSSLSSSLSPHFTFPLFQVHLFMLSFYKYDRLITSNHRVITWSCYTTFRKLSCGPQIPENKNCMRLRKLCP